MAQNDPIEGLPEDLARVLRDQSIIVPQDQAVWELLAKWRNAPSDTASAFRYPDHLTADAHDWELPAFDPYLDDDDRELECTHCGGEGTCEDGSDPLVTCPEEPHPCHACNGSGLRRDQRIW
jgi:hypothetical protein